MVAVITESDPAAARDLDDIGPERIVAHEDDLVVTFEGLIAGSSLVPQIKALLAVLAEKLSTPVEIEFAHDGTDFYLVQCRPQSTCAE